MDIYEQAGPGIGRGVGGIIIDVLLKNGYNAGSISVKGIA